MNGDEIVLHLADDAYAAMTSHDWSQLAQDVRAIVAASLPALIRTETDRQLRKARGRVD